MDNFQHSELLALETTLGDESGDPIAIPLSVLQAITNNFSDDQEIGCGGFGAVYKGTLGNGMVVAVKKLHENVAVLSENFNSEVRCLIEVKHKNIVRFLGYCSDTQKLLMPFEGKNVWAEARKKLLCFEYLSKGSLADYLTGPSCGLQWCTRYRIIRGVCEGLQYLHHHHQPIIHLDLKPQNILLDDDMVAKIADFGLSRCLSASQSRIITENKAGTPGYFAPEFINSGLITMKTDIYSLGVIIIEILMGFKQQLNLDQVLESWTSTFGTSQRHTLLQQVKVCAEIGINCTNYHPENRPTIDDIIHRLEEMDLSNSSPGNIASTSSAPLSGVNIYPLELCFLFEPDKRIDCLLSITNMTGRYVNYWVVPQFPNMYTPCKDELVNEICTGTKNLDPMSTGSFNVTMLEQQQPPLDAGMFEIVMITMESRSDLIRLKSSIGDEPKIDGELVKQVEEVGGEVHTTMLRVVISLPSGEGVVPKIVLNEKFADLRSIDAHPTQPWILVGHDKLLSIWDYKKQATVAALVVVGATMVYSVRFIPQRHWFVAGDDSGYIHVYSCVTRKEVERFQARDGDSSYVISLAIHPTNPYLLSACTDGVVKLWDWDKGWECIQTVHSTAGWIQVKFNPKDTDTFTSCCAVGTMRMKVWSIYPSDDQPIAAIEQNSSSLFDHVFTEGEQNHVVILIHGLGLQIWDLETKTRVHTLHGTKRWVRALACHPTLPVIAVGIQEEGSEHPAVRFWNSTNYMLEKIVNCTFGSRIRDFAFVGKTRLVIGTEEGIEILDIDIESLA